MVIGYKTGKSCHCRWVHAPAGAEATRPLKHPGRVPSAEQPCSLPGLGSRGGGSITQEKARLMRRNTPRTPLPCLPSALRGEAGGTASEAPEGRRAADSERPRAAPAAAPAPPAALAALPTASAVPAAPRRKPLAEPCRQPGGRRAAGKCISFVLAGAGQQRLGRSSWPRERHRHSCCPSPDGRDSACP